MGLLNWSLQILRTINIQQIKGGLAVRNHCIQSQSSQEISLQAGFLVWLQKRGGDVGYLSGDSSFSLCSRELEKRMNSPQTCTLCRRSMDQGSVQFRTKFLPLANTATPSENTIWKWKYIYIYVLWWFTILRKNRKMLSRCPIRGKLVFSTNFDSEFQYTKPWRRNSKIILRKNNLLCHNPFPVSWGLSCTRVFNWKV